MRIDRRAVRYGAAGISAVMAVIYILIGLGILDVGSANGDLSFLWVFGALAGGAFLLGAVLLVSLDRRWLWMVGTVFQVFVYVAYFNVAPQRDPTFEVWGITLRIIQVPLAVALAWLALRPAVAGLR